MSDINPNSIERAQDATDEELLELLKTHAFPREAVYEEMLKRLFEERTKNKKAPN